MRSGPEIPMAGENGAHGSGGYIGKETNPRENNNSDRTSNGGKSYDINLPVGTLFDHDKWRDSIFEDSFIRDVKDWIDENQNLVGAAVSLSTIINNALTISSLLTLGTTAPISLAVRGALAIPSVFLNGYFFGTAISGNYNKSTHFLSSLSYSPTKLSAFSFSLLTGKTQNEALTNAKYADYIEKTIRLTNKIGEMKNEKNPNDNKLRMSELP
jgi:hypothetical protein